MHCDINCTKTSGSCSKVLHAKYFDWKWLNFSRIFAPNTNNKCVSKKCHSVQCNCLLQRKMVVDTCYYKNYNNDNSNYGVFTVFLHGSYTSVKKYIYIYI